MAQDKSYTMNLSAEAVKNIKKVVEIGIDETPYTVHTNMTFEGDDLDELYKHTKLVFDGSDSAVNINAVTPLAITENGEYDAVTITGDTSTGYTYEGNAKVNVNVGLDTLIQPTDIVLNYVKDTLHDHLEDKVTCIINKPEYATQFEIEPLTFDLWSKTSEEEAVNHYDLQLVEDYDDTTNSVINLTPIDNSTDYTLTVTFDLTKGVADEPEAFVSRSVNVDGILNALVEKFDSLGKVFTYTITNKPEQE